MITHARTLDISKEELDSLGLFGSIIGHVGDGNFHETILFDGPSEKAMVEDVVHRMVHRAIEMDGTCTVSSSLILLPASY